MPRGVSRGVPTSTTSPRLLVIDAPGQVFSLLRSLNLGVKVRRGRGSPHSPPRQGAADKEIGQALGIATATAQRHVSNVLRRLDVPNRAAAVGAVSDLSLSSWRQHSSSS